MLGGEVVQANDATVVAPTRDSLRRELKAWERAFLAKHGRQPQPDDLKSEPLIKAKYIEYEAVKKKERMSQTTNNQERSAAPSDRSRHQDKPRKDSFKATEDGSRKKERLLDTTDNDSDLDQRPTAAAAAPAPRTPTRPAASSRPSSGLALHAAISTSNDNLDSEVVEPTPVTNRTSSFILGPLGEQKPQSNFASVFGAHVNKSSASASLAASESTSTAISRKAVKQGIDITEEAFDAQKDERNRDRPPRGRRGRMSSQSQRNDSQEARRPLADLELENDKPVAAVEEDAMAVDDTQDHRISLPEMSLAQLTQALDSEEPQERGLSVFDESTWHDTDDFSLPLPGQAAYHKKRPRGKANLLFSPEENRYGRQVEWPAGGDETDVSLDQTDGENNWENQDSENRAPVFNDTLMQEHVQEDEEDGSDKENVPSDLDSSLSMRKKREQQERESRVSKTQRGRKRRAEVVEAAMDESDEEVEDAEEEESEDEGEADESSDGSEVMPSKTRKKKGKSKKVEKVAKKTAPRKKRRSKGGDAADSEDSDADAAVESKPKKQAKKASAPKSVSQNFVSLKINKRGNLGKYGKAMARRGGNRFAKISSVGSSYSTKFENTGKRKRAGNAEDGFGGFGGVVVEDLEFEVEVPTEVSATTRREEEQPSFFSRDAPFLLSDVFKNKSVDEEMDHVEVRVDLDKALEESGLGSEFRQGQREAVESVLSGGSTLVVMPTGSGKSLLYQLPTYILSRVPETSPSLTLVVAPTISLMEDQLRNLPPTIRGATISSQRDNVQEVVEDLCAGNIDVLFVTPERLQSQTFVNFLKSGACPPVKLACIDEAHCLSEWSHNFRPAFLHLDRALRESLEVPVILALTGTATSQARRDICKMLNLDKTIDNSTVRSNLYLSASRDDDRDVAIFNLLRSSPWRDMNSIIIYCMRRDQCDSLASYLRARNFQADSYHAGRTPDERHIIQSNFFTGRIKVLVATVAYGMGINKPDIRGIVHHSLPKSLENYVQEIGRAGRDGLPAYCHLFLSREDYVKLRSFAFADAPYKAAVEKLVSAVFLKKKAASGKGGNKKRQSLPVAEEAVGQCQMAVPVETIESEMDLKKEVAATLLTYMELHHQDLLHVMPVGHSSCSIRFIKTPREELAEQEPIVASILRNAEEVNTSAPLVFEVLDVCQELEMPVTELRAKLRSLKAKKEIHFDFTKEAFLVQIERTTNTVERHAIVEELCSEVKRLEQIRVQKVDDIYQAFWPISSMIFSETLPKLVDEDSDDEPVQDAQESAANKGDASLKQSLATYFSAEVEEEQHGDQPKKVSRWGFVDPILIERQKQEYPDMHTNIRIFIWKHKGVFPSGRIVARILHGLESPKYPASEWNETNLWNKGKHFNFRELERMADDSLRLYRESKDKNKDKGSDSD